MKNFYIVVTFFAAILMAGCAAGPQPLKPIEDQGSLHIITVEEGYVPTKEDRIKEAQSYLDCARQAGIRSCTYMPFLLNFMAVHDLTPEMLGTTWLELGQLLRPIVPTPSPDVMDDPFGDGLWV